MDRRPIAAMIVSCALLGPAGLARPACAAAAPLRSCLAELEKKPRDQELRAKAIEAVLKMPSPPAIPEKASELKGWADAALGDAKTRSDASAAAQAYEKALDLAPWLADLYRGCADAHEKAGDYASAAASLRLYLLADPAAKDAEQARERIGALDYKAQRAGAKAPPEPAASSQGADLLARLKKQAAGRYTRAFDCGRYSPIQALRKRERMECDQAEYDAGRWYSYDPLGSREFRFPGDGTIELWDGGTIGASLELRGAPRGPRLEDVDWRRCDGQRCAAPVWVRLSDDLNTITYSIDRPVDNAAFDSKARYAYRQYRK